MLQNIYYIPDINLDSPDINPDFDVGADLLACYSASGRMAAQCTKG